MGTILLHIKVDTDEISNSPNEMDITVDSGFIEGLTEEDLKQKAQRVIGYPIKEIEIRK